MNNFNTKTKEIKEGEFIKNLLQCSVTIDVRHIIKKRRVNPV
ncbi:hypothetical protein [Gemella sp. ND 6198]|nr:hypothetical protein [Gemella sp. ND 6198]